MQNFLFSLLFYIYFFIERNQSFFESIFCIKIKGIFVSCEYRYFYIRDSFFQKMSLTSFDKFFSCSFSSKIRINEELFYLPYFLYLSSLPVLSFNFSDYVPLNFSFIFYKKDNILRTKKFFDVLLHFCIGVIDNKIIISVFE